MSIMASFQFETLFQFGNPIYKAVEFFKYSIFVFLALDWKTQQCVLLSSARETKKYLVKTVVSLRETCRSIYDVCRPMIAEGEVCQSVLSAVSR